ncbi:hypothetical protein BDV98DRAFT_583546 [Pterulicium gracile]|uniref:Uncharacterized protein n=1 Tax=Pterulicium gracile TaxID=1884261 RepID=A0A5C3QFM3_9AGAR|nr:hypothetical protein BDV98DRAFT_583546 [Pterula gracilis]
MTRASSKRDASVLDMEMRSEEVHTREVLSSEAGRGVVEDQDEVVVKVLAHDTNVRLLYPSPAVKMNGVVEDRDENLLDVSSEKCQDTEYRPRGGIVAGSSEPQVINRLGLVRGILMSRSSKDIGVWTRLARDWGSLLGRMRVWTDFVRWRRSSDDLEAWARGTRGWVLWSGYDG